MVTDNIGVESVYLMYAKNGGLVHRDKMMPMGDGKYCGAIPGPSMVGDYFDYYIYAMDESYSGNVTRMPATGAYHFEIVEEFVWDFEPDDGGFVQTGDVWEWGTPTSGPGAAHSGVNLWATMLAGDYPNSANATLDIPPITLAASKPYAMLSFWHWYYMETNYDGGNVKVSTDGGATWTVVTPVGGYDGTASSDERGHPRRAVLHRVPQQLLAAGDVRSLRVRRPDDHDPLPLRERQQRARSPAGTSTTSR